MQIYNIDNISELTQPSVVTIGMFDGVHVGHRSLLRLLLDEGAKRNLAPIVVTFDRHPRQVLGKGDDLRMLSTYDERMELLASCGVPQVVVVHFTAAVAALSACQFVQQVLLPRLHMQCLVLGYDNFFGSRRNNDFDRLPALARREHFDIVRDTAVLLDGVEAGSTKVRSLLAEGDIAFANRMLATPYRLSGRVVPGRQVGRALGFPTANLAMDDAVKMLPKEGVYAVLASAMDGRGVLRQWKGVANLGPQPTFGQAQSQPEVHLFDCHDNLYGSTLTLQFIAYLRGTRCFASAEELVQQLKEDCRHAGHLLSSYEPQIRQSL